MTLARITPDQAILLLTAGVLLIYLELNRPGWIIPGALGLLATLLAIATLSQTSSSPVAAVLCISAVALLAVSLRKAAPTLVAAAATLTLTLGFTELNPGIHHLVAVPCGLLLGVGTSVLTHIARRARANKGLD
jgi:membrane-bound serine protease (ClpP class)